MALHGTLLFVLVAVIVGCSQPERMVAPRREGENWKHDSYYDHERAWSALVACYNKLAYVPCQVRDLAPPGVTLTDLGNALPPYPARILRWSWLPGPAVLVSACKNCREDREYYHRFCEKSSGRVRLNDQIVKYTCECDCTATSGPPNESFQRTRGRVWSTRWRRASGDP